MADKAMGPLAFDRCSCGASTFVALSEPEGQPRRFDIAARRMWRIVQISPSHSVAVVEQVYDAHECKSRKTIGAVPKKREKQ